MKQKSKQYWLMKSEADCYSIDDLKNDKTTSWGGVRNYQARNFMMNDMSVGDIVFFYHSNGTKLNPTGIYGIASVCSTAHPDETQFNKRDDHYDPKATIEKPIWYCVDIKFTKKLKQSMTLAEIKFDPNLAGIMLAQTGSRLSIQPVSQKHGEYLINNLK
ncbi:MAG: EVE domain-containing protein [Candidatus Pacebacteria bacterium]|nr:EVE domain-containing protein [Candidatus Paceibacterota bacterium]